MTAALLIIDVQQGFINEYTAHIPPRVQELQGQYTSVFASRFVNPERSPYRTFMHWERFAPQAAETNLAFATARNTIIFEKSVYSCISPHLLETLHEQSISEVHLCGIDTECCVLKTAVDLFEAGIRPVILSDACASHAGPALHEMGLTILRRMIGADQVR